MSAVGIVLAAGAGTRYGRPKATVVDDGGSWLNLAVEALARGGCDRVVVVLGAEVDESRTLLDGSVRVVVAEDWADGVSTSLRRGLAAAAEEPAERAVVTLVDLPDVGPAVVDRLLAAARGPAALARAVYAGRPGHPVVLGRDHWGEIHRTVAGDRGAGEYLEAHRATGVECGDLASGLDVDTVEQTVDQHLLPGRPAPDPGPPGGAPPPGRLVR
jgi:CTP:molybdopterin cytidylyltransferase MocA